MTVLAWATTLNLVDVRILKTVHAPSGLGLVSGVCLLPAKDKARGDHPFTVFFSEHIRLRGVHDGHRLTIEYSLPFGFDCFRKLRLLFGRKVFPGYLVGVPSTEIKFSMQCPRLGRRYRKGSVFLASSGVEVSSLLPSGCSSSFHLWSASIVRVGQVASSFCSLPKVLPRSRSCRVALQSGYHMQRLCSPVGARTWLLRRKEGEQRIHWSQLVSAFSHAVPPSTLDPRIRPDDVSVNLSLLEIELCDH